MSRPARKPASDTYSVQLSLTDTDTVPSWDFDESKLSNFMLLLKDELMNDPQRSGLSSSAACTVGIPT